ncbi:MAG: serine/threonine protein kinase [Myxococcota bacterium]|nr:serine/threonine protein kinase [Myxococcota bacterium]
MGSGVRYEILERLGSGAHGEGYLAQRIADGERVFLKVLKSDLSDDGEWAQRFCDEVSLLRACLHPNIVRYVEAYRQETGELCLVTEYLEGEDLKARLRKSGALPPRHVLSLALPLCNALDSLHGREVVHRDLTPENIFISGRFPDVVPRLLDFGLAWSAGPRVAQTGASLALTPLYAAPECLAGERATPASDIYSLGVILYEALSGAPPFTANTIDALLERQRKGQVAQLPPGSASLLPVVKRCLAARPEERWASAGELARALQAAVDQLPGGERTESSRPLPRPTAGRPDSLGTVGNYELVRELGKGGMGKVYLARHTKLGRQVAIKMLHSEAMSDRDAVARFFNEARTVNAINHEHIVEIFDFVEEDGPNPRTYCVMELLVGDNLSQLRKRAPLPLRRILHLCRQVADALAAAHRAGVVHRDVKPANIFVTTRSGLTDYVKVLDFGVAKVNLPLPGGEETPSVNTQTGLSLGTPDYMSPEQVTAAPVDGRTDVFALGVMLYELLAGFRPFVGTNVAHLVVKVVREPHTPLPEQAASGEKIPLGLTRLVNRCLEKRREDRPQTMEEVSAAFERILQNLSTPAASAPLPEEAPEAPPTEGPASNLSALLPAVAPARSRGPWPVVVGLGVLLLAGGLLVAQWTGPARTPITSEPLANSRQVTPPEAVVATPSVPTAEPPASAEAARLASASAHSSGETVSASAPAPAPAPAPVALSVHSSPGGATLVRSDTGARLGSTPFAGTLPFSEKPLKLRVELAGHAPREETVSPNRDVSLTLALSPLAPEQPRPVRKAPARRKPVKEDPNAPLDPFASE